MTSIDALAKAIKEYEGGVVIVSHDFRAYLFRVARRRGSTTKLFSLARLDLASCRGALGGEEQDHPQSDEGGHLDCRLQEDARERK